MASRVRRSVQRELDIVPPLTPECDKQLQVKDDAQKLGEFLDYLREKYTIRETDELRAYRRNGLLDLPQDTEKILADYFEIDLDELEREKRMILAHQRMVNAREEAREVLGIP